MDEYIEREALEKKLNERLAYLLDKNGPYDHFTDGYDEAVSTVEEFPAADVAPVVHGRWEQDAYGDWYCTNCDEVVAICESGRERTYRKPYCPNCGAKMDGGADNDTDGSI